MHVSLDTGDSAYMTLERIKVELKSRYSTYQTPYKLTKFKICQ